MAFTTTHMEPLVAESNVPQGDVITRIRSELRECDSESELGGFRRADTALYEAAAEEIERLRGVLRLIAEMPASTHAIDAELCREALEPK